MNDSSLKYFTFGILIGLIICIASELIARPLQTDPLFVETVVTSCVPYGA